MDKISFLFGAKKEDQKELHFSHARAEYSHSALLFCICARRASTGKREREEHFVMSSSALASSFSVFVFDYGTKTNAAEWEEDTDDAETILEKKRSIRTREAAEEYDDDSDGNESGSDDDARTAKAVTERTEQRFQPLAFAHSVGTEKLVPSRV